MFSLSLSLCSTTYIKRPATLICHEGCHTSVKWWRETGWHPSSPTATISDGEAADACAVTIGDSVFERLCRWRNYMVQAFGPSSLPSLSLPRLSVWQRYLFLAAGITATFRSRHADIRHCHSCLQGASLQLHYMLLHHYASQEAF